MKKEEYYMIREYNQYSLCKHLNNGMSISVTTIYAKNSGEAESMARISRQLWERNNTWWPACIPIQYKYNIYYRQNHYN